MSAKSKAVKFASVGAEARIDATAGIIFGVSVCTEGPALGHSAWSEERMQSVPIYADATTLKQLMASALQYKGGLKVKLNHDSGAGDIVGALREFRIEGTQLKADFHLLKSSDRRQYILDIASEIPDAFGLSVSFSGPYEFSKDQALARCTEIYSCDVVDEPAANPNGLFDAGRSNEALHPNFTMDEATKNEFSALLKPILEKIEALESRVPTAEAQASAFSAKVESVVKTQLAATVDENQEKLITKMLGKITFGVAPGAAAGASGSGKDKGTEKFEDAVAAHKAAGKKHSEALDLAMAEKPELHAAYLSRVSAGEVIKL